MSHATTPVHVRTLRMEAVESGPGEFTVTGTLLDERPRGSQWFGIQAPTVIHRMQVAMRVRSADLIVTGVEARMEAHPYTICPEALPSLQDLVGVSVVKGFTRAVNERIGRHHGCAHMTSLIHAMGPVAKQAAGALVPRRPFKERRGDLWFVNTCYAWREHGPLHRLAEAGDDEGIQRLAAYGGPAGPASPSSG